MHSAYPSYQPALGTASGNGTYGPGAGNGAYAGYGSVSYPNNAAIQDLQSMDTRRRAIEALNDFLGDIKRRAINPNSYYDVGQRLGAGGSLPLPVGGGYNTGYSGNAASGGGNSNFNGFSAGSLLDTLGFTGGNDSHGGGGLSSLTHSGYSLPMSNARTKNDLQDIDRFLESLQQTVYETSNQQAAAGIQQPGVHAHFAGDYGFSNHYGSRSSLSPPTFNQTSGASSFGAMTAASMPSVSSSASALDTPALTPASVSSYSSSGQSPMSSHGGRSSIGSSAQPMYPSLPSVTGMSDFNSGYSVTTSAPASGLASGFEGLDGRRYSGGKLQRQAPAASTDVEMRDAPEDGQRTPKAAAATVPEAHKEKASSSIDPALRADASDGTSTPRRRSEEAAEKRQEDWVENIRTIETLRKWIADRLARGDFEEGEVKEGAPAAQVTPADDGENEIAKLVAARLASENAKTENTAAEKPAEQAKEAPKEERAHVNYPNLPA